MRQVHVPLADETDRDMAVRGCVPARARGPDRHRTTTTSGGSVTPTVIQRLHEVLSAERVELGSHGHHDFDTWVWMTQRTDTAIAVVEQALAAKDAEIAELRKRPRLDEVLSYLPSVFAREPALLEQIGVEMRALYAEKARAEAPK